MSEELKPCQHGWTHRHVYSCVKCELESLRASLRASEEKLKVAVGALVYYSHHAVKVYTALDSDDYEQYDDKETALEALSLISNPALLQLAEARDSIVEDYRRLLDVVGEADSDIMVKYLADHDAALKAVTEKR